MNQPSLLAAESVNTESASSSSRAGRFVIDQLVIERLDHDVVTALVLSQLDFYAHQALYRPPVVQYEGREWMVLTGVDLAQITSLTQKQARRALDRLRGLGVVEVVVKKVVQVPKTLIWVNREAVENLRSESPNGKTGLAPEGVSLRNAPEGKCSSYRERESISRDRVSKPYETDFEDLWKTYPRKDAKKAALRCYIARRREGIAAADLLTATQNYATTRRGEEAKFTLQGTTFLGPNERWRDFLVLTDGKPATTRYTINGMPVDD